MPENNAILSGLTRAMYRHRGLILPVGAILLVLVMLVPLPPVLIDVLLVANIALAAMILLTAIYVSSPLEFSVFPSVLLGATLFRLVLNVATTRLILTAGAGGRSLGEAQTAAGGVIWAFSDFVTTGSLAVGVILFLIIVVVQFVVITRGASRISEVSARFMLDAMPGKQMAIDADVNASLITEEQARSRRTQISREADFYGAMDGASKFVRGDAVAALIITMVNIFGGLYVGMVQYGWGGSQTLSLFTRLTIGDGLVTQIPAFLVSLSAALIVSRSTVRTDLGKEVVRQLTAKPVALGITSAFLAALMLTSLPKVPLLMLSVGLAGLALMLRNRRRSGEYLPSPAPAASEPPAESEPAPPAVDAEEFPTVDLIRIEIGYALVQMVETSQGGEVLDRIAALRRQIASEMGLRIPPVRIRDNLHLDPHEYAIYVRGAKVGSAQLFPQQLLALAEETPVGKLVGRETIEPAFGTPAVWIDPDERPRAERLNYTVVEPAGVMMTHLGRIIRFNAAELLSRQHVVQMLGSLKAHHGELVDEIRRTAGIGKVRHILQGLLREAVPIRDLEAILEAILEGQDHANDIGGLLEHVRLVLSRMLSQQYCSEDGKLWCICLDRDAEHELETHLDADGVGAALAVGPELAGKVARAVGDGLTELRSRRRRPVVLCAPRLRAPLRDLIHSAQPDAAVLGYNEINAVEVKAFKRVGIGV